MTKKPNKAKSGTVSTAKAENAFAWFEIDTLNLFTIELQQDPALESEKEKENFINVTVKPFFRYPSTDIGFVDVIVGRKADTPAATKIVASYVFAIKMNKENVGAKDRDAFLMHFARDVVWHKFRDTFGFIISQASLDFPTLPISPPGVTYDNAELAVTEA
jgi:hypothetical protein